MPLLHQVAGLPKSNYVIVDNYGGDYVCIQDAIDDVNDSLRNPVTIINKFTDGCSILQ